MGCCCCDNADRRKSNADYADDVDMDECCGSKGGSTCICFPYNDGYIIAAQIVSIVTVLVSWVWWVSFIVSTVAMILLQIIWCCRQNRCGFLASAMVTGTAALAGLGGGIYMLLVWKDKRWCDPFTWITWEYDPDPSYTQYDNCSEVAYAVVSFVLSAMWFVVTGCIAWFVASGRHARWEKRWGKPRAGGEEAAEEAVAVVVPAAVPALAPGDPIKEESV